MPRTVKDLMTPNPTVLGANRPIEEAAMAMRDKDLGAVIVTEGNDICGIVTDRDISVRAVAEGKDCAKTTLGEICSKELTTAKPDLKLEDAVKLMRDKAVRRIPVVEGSKPVGIISIGDLAMEKDKESALATISAAPANH